MSVIRLQSIYWNTFLRKPIKRWAYMLGDTAEMLAPSWRKDLKLCSNLFERLYSCSNKQHQLRPWSCHI